jgi:hypothetical protein
MSDLTLPFVYDPAQHLAGLAHVTHVSLHRMNNAVARNDRQIQALAISQVAVSDPLPGTDPFREQGHWYSVEEAARNFRSINGDPIFQDKVFLFNLIIGLEWRPSRATLQEIRLAARRASAFLYDVTDGYMAIGQVIIGGPELLDAADIQVLASNRLHPRAWNEALHNEAKYQPIRVGRGLWQKNRDLLFPWSSPEGYRTLIHEWGHYAFGMVDRYLAKRHYDREDPAQPTWSDDRKINLPIAVAVPKIALPVESVMANQEISEYSDEDQPFVRISAKFHQAITRSKILTGPEELPLRLPIYPTLNPPPGSQAGQEVQLALGSFFKLYAEPLGAQQPQDPNAKQRLNPNDTVGIIAESHWVYVLKYEADSAAEALPKRIIAQGKLSNRDKRNGFRLLGADTGDRIVIVSEVGGRVQVHGGTLLAGEVKEGTLQASEVQGWDDLTPYDTTTSAFDTPFFVDVIPQTLVDIDLTVTPTPRIVDVAVSITASRQPDDVFVYRYGSGPRVDMDWSAATPAAAGDIPTLKSGYKTVDHLDGHIFLRWRDADGEHSKLFICSYSQGGGPASIGGKPSISGGSAEGNAMLFFLGPDAVGADDLDQPPADYSMVRIVTTVLPAHGPLVVEGRLAAPDDVESRSYVFSLASNEPLTEYAATLVLYYDNDAPKYGGDLYIYRWDSVDATWQRLTTIVPSDLAYIAVPITKTTREVAPSFIDKTAGLRIERYRILWKRK